MGERLSEAGVDEIRQAAWDDDCARLMPDDVQRLLADLREVTVELAEVNARHAADLITLSEVMAERDALRAALEEIADVQHDGTSLLWIQHHVRAALAKVKP